MQVYQVRMKIFMLYDVQAVHMNKKITAFLDKGFATDNNLLEFHEKNEFKFYCFDLPYPIEADGIYKKGKIYTITIRTIRKSLANYFYEVCVNQFTNEIKGLTAEIRILPKKMIDTLYTLTPAILKTDSGYWRSSMQLQEFEERLKVNLIKKWNHYHGEKINEEFELYTTLEFTNTAPIVFEYKEIKLLGDKIRLHIADNEQAQNLAYMALGTGMLELNSRGAGYVNYRWL